MQDESFTFTATGRGAINRYEWSVDGQAFAGTPRADGRPGSSLAYRFDQPGRHVVPVVGYAEKAEQSPSDERTVTVIARPELVLVQPQADETVYFARPLILRVQVDGPVEQVAWTVRQKGAEGKVLQQALRPVARTAAGPILEWTVMLPEMPEETDAVVEARGVLSSDLDVAAPQVSVSIHVG